MKAKKELNTYFPQVHDLVVRKILDVFIFFRFFRFNINLIVQF